MDCGKEFKAVIEKDTGKTLNCWYYGIIDMECMRFGWAFDSTFLDEDFEKENPSMWQRWAREYIPAYLTPWEVKICTTPSYWKRLKLLILSKLHYFDKDRYLELWVCPECMAIEKRTEE